MYYLGVDIGGTSIKAGLVTEKGHLVYKETTPTQKDAGYKALAKDIADLVFSVFSKNNMSQDEILAIGIGYPGSVDNENGTIIYSNNISVDKGSPIREELRKYIKKPVYLGNDADCAALGEYFAIGDEKIKNLVAVTFGTGVGCGIIIDKKIYTGSNGSAGEVGHTVIVMDGEECTCGRKGCWEAYASVTALIRDAKKAASDNPSSLLCQRINENGGNPNGKMVFDCAQSGDETSKKLLDRYIRYIGEGIVNLINIFQPEYVVVGGGISNQKDALIDPVKEYVSSRIYGAGRILCPKIVAAKMGNDAGIIGAALLAL